MQQIKESKRRGCWSETNDDLCLTLEVPKLGFDRESCPVLESGHCPCSCCHRNFFCCADFVVWPSPCSASAVERRGQYSATIQRLSGLQFLFAAGFKKLQPHQASPWICCSDTSTAVRQWQKKRTDSRAVTFCPTSLTPAQQRKKKKKNQC